MIDILYLHVNVISIIVYISVPTFYNFLQEKLLERQWIRTFLHSLVVTIHDRQKQLKLMQDVLLFYLVFMYIAICKDITTICLKCTRSKFSCVEYFPICTFYDGSILFILYVTCQKIFVIITKLTFNFYFLAQLTSKCLKCIYLPLCSSECKKITVCQSTSSHPQFFFSRRCNY